MASAATLADIPTYEAIHTRFDDEPAPPKASLFRLLKLLVPAAFSSLWKFYTVGPAKQEWSLAYGVAVPTLRQLLGQLNRSPDGAPPHVKAVQARNRRESKVPSTTRVTPDSFWTREHVIDFIYAEAPGEWPEPNANDIVEISGEWVQAKEALDDVIVYLLHGGAYCLGSAQMHRFLSQKISAAAQVTVFAINYRLAPQNPYPCALIDALSGYFYLVEKHPGKKIVLQGDSAGGGLCIATLLALRDMGCTTMPDGAYLLSPWCDLSHSMPSFEGNSHSDYLPSTPLIDPRLGKNRLHYYAPDSCLQEPYISPLFAPDLSNLPPMLIQVGSAEKLHDEVVAFASKCIEAGSRVELEIYTAHVHVFQIFAFAKGAKKAIARAGRWIESLTRGDRFLLTKEHGSSHTLFDFNGEMVAEEPPSFLMK
ncbi:hypothetical protein HDU91_001798 [Kappamyces sp. JEL0680]|nr:hypothetical protein HDU91_001798 [Kappamyces sp. JEL0680]